MRLLSLTFHLFQRFAHRNLAQENTACADPGALKSPLPRPFDRSGVLRIERNLKASKALYKRFLILFRVNFIYLRTRLYRACYVVAIPRSGDRARSNAYGAERRPEVSIVLVI